MRVNRSSWRQPRGHRPEDGGGGVVVVGGEAEDDHGCVPWRASLSQVARWGRKPDHFFFTLPCRALKRGLVLLMT